MTDTVIAPPIENAVSIETGSTEFQTAAEPVVETAPVAAPSGEKEKEKERRPRGWLEGDVKTITDKFVEGQLSVDGDKPLTPHRLARFVKQESNLEEIPSTGAVAAVLKRWVDLGFAEVSEKPFAFTGYTSAGRTEGLKALKASRSENRKATREATKVTKAATESTAG